jgi:hypothetical protein
MDSTDDFCSNCGTVNRNKISTLTNNKTVKQSHDNISESNKKHLDERTTSQIKTVSIEKEKKNTSNSPILKKSPKKNNSLSHLFILVIGFLLLSAVVAGILTEEPPETNTNLQDITSTSNFPTSTESYPTGELNSSNTNTISVNDIDSSDSIQLERNIQICEQVASDYSKTHTYTGDDIFDCDNMAQDVWNILETKGINSRIMVGNVDMEGPVTLEDCNHAWIIAEVSPNTWLAIECTGGYIVYAEDNEQYYQGFSFGNPKNYQRFLDLYNDWVYQYQDYENYRLYYNSLVDEYNDADASEQVNLQSGLIVARNTLDEKEKVFITTNAELTTLLEYG